MTRTPTPPYFTPYPRLTDEDKRHMRQWRAAGFRISAIAKAYGVRLAVAARVVRGVKREIGD